MQNRATLNKQQALWQQGQRYGRMEQWRQAADAFEAIVDRDPSFVPAWLELCSAKEKLDAYRDARKAVLRAAETVQVPPMVGMVVARRLRQFEALPELQRYIRDTHLLERISPELMVDMATFFASAGDHAMTLPWIEHVLKQRPDFAEAHNMHGVALMFAGRSEESAAAFERALRIRPNYSNAYALLSRVAKIGPDNNRVGTLRRLLSQSNLSAKDETNYLHALHNELHDLGDYDAAWAALARMCIARKPSQLYDHAKTLGMFDAIRRTFDAEFSRAGPAADYEGPIPIFIVGLHRSGTTLLERILSGHPEVADAGETYTFTAQLRYAADHFCRVVADPVIVERASGFDYAAVGRGFLDGMRWRSQGKAFITEKLNPNFVLLGPIAKALPQARLLHMHRDPADTCFSNLRTLFTHEAAYSYDQVEMADYCRAYHDLMAHWRGVLPGRVVDIEYDEMVNAPEAQARRISAHCGFDFVPEMLKVERNSGMVATASSNQVRKGIMTNRGGVWRAYERHLGPMLDRLTMHGLL